MFRIVKESNPKKVLKIGNTWITTNYMCKSCYDMLKSKFKYGLNLKWKTIDENGKLISAIPENPTYSFGVIKKIKIDQTKRL